MDTTNKTTAARFAKMAIDRARAACGAGWSMFSRDLQVRLVHAEILTIVRGWDDSTGITAAKIDAIVDAADALLK